MQQLSRVFQILWFDLLIGKTTVFYAKNNNSIVKIFGLNPGIKISREL